jgi:hypothetical protein
LHAQAARRSGPQLIAGVSRTEAVEALGLLIAFPAVLFANLGYAFFAQALLRRQPTLRPWLLLASVAVIALVAADVVLVSIIGAFSTRVTIGPVYWKLHLLGVTLGAPALANLLLRNAGRPSTPRWFVLLVAGVCFGVGICLVLFNVAVGESLFGPDGVGGPFATGA